MPRSLAWLVVLALIVGARVFDSAPLRAACLPAVLLMLALTTPPLRVGLLGFAAAVALASALGHGAAMLDLTPAFVAALIGWIFLRTLQRGRRPLIARLIAAIDGPAQLDDAATARYARSLTWLWACYQGALAAAAAAVAVRAWTCPGCAPALPAPPVFGIVVLPLAVAALLLGEFLLRPRLLPQAPRHSIAQFARAMLRAWPAALAD